MNITIKTTTSYEKEISRLLSCQEREKLENMIAENPLFWPVIRETGGLRKARFSRDNLGKSSGGRVCYIYLQIHKVIYMIKAYAKNSQENLSSKEKKDIKKLVDLIKKAAGEKL